MYFTFGQNSKTLYSSICVLGISHFVIFNIIGCKYRYFNNKLVIMGIQLSDLYL